MGSSAQKQPWTYLAVSFSTAGVNIHIINAKVVTLHDFFFWDHLIQEILASLYFYFKKKNDRAVQMAGWGHKYRLSSLGQSKWQ